MEALAPQVFTDTSYYRFPGGRKKLEALLHVVEDLGARGLRVLDVGCGNGALSFPLAAIGCAVVGVDVDAASIEHCRTHGFYPNARFVHTRGRLEEVVGPFDLIVCSEVLEHLDAPDPLILAMRDKLAPGGRLFVTVPNGYGLREIGGRVERWLRESCGLERTFRWLRARFARVGMVSEREKYQMHTSNPEQGHVQKFTRPGFERCLAGAGFEVEEWTNSFVILSVFFCRGGQGRLERIDAWAADHLPAAFASGWYVTCAPRRESGAALTATSAR